MSAHPKRTCFFLAAVFLLSSGVCRAAGDAGTRSADFLNLLSDARTGAMGDAYSPVVGNANAVFLNPARLASVGWHDLSVSYLSWLEGISYKQIAYAGGVDKKDTLAVGLGYLTSGAIESRDEYDRVTGNFEVTDLALALGYGKYIGSGFAVGGAVKFIREKIKSDSGSGLAGDFGATYDAGYSGHALTVSVNLQHLGWELGAGEKSPLPTTLRAGLADRLFGGKAVLCGELVRPFDRDAGFNTGAEFLVADYLALRAGYRFGRDDMRGFDALSFGFGLNYPGRRVYLLDYACSFQGDLGATHRVNVGVRF